MLLIKHGTTSNIIRFTLKHATTGQGLTGLTNTSSGLIISTICDVEATPVVYTAAANNIETITTLGTYSAPSSGKCRFREVSATNHKGLYEFQFANARFAVTNARKLVISVTGATNLLDADYEIQLVGFDPHAEISDEVIEGTMTWKHITRILISAVARKSAGGGTNTLTFRDGADSKNRIVATVDANGNRTAVTLDGT